MERTAPAVPYDDQSEDAWEEPLTRLLLLLELADRPAWLREAARPRRKAG